ncbi:myotubularin-related protein DDB_G0290005-like [Panonychus citri]|uniref:myotubularin-related protein DDB_G0290005-like n=1 Tax=Panonychus citri TaxID=50023 RepID=UPI00230799EC|nr:myotubularin-related protein DDB_G0290005-like [Panonychus citri]
MSNKKKKYNCRFPPARIKKIMQADEEVGKVAAVVPLIISRALELFVESLLTESSKITKSRNARTLTPSHLKACITSNSQFSFLREFVSTIPDIQSVGEDGEHSDGNSSTGNNNYAHSIQGSTSGHHHHHHHSLHSHSHHPISSSSLITSSPSIIIPSSSSSITSAAATTAATNTNTNSIINTTITTTLPTTTGTGVAATGSISFSGSNLTRQVSTTNRSTRSTNSCFSRVTTSRGRGRPRKVNVTSSRSQEDEEDGDYDEENDINERTRNVNKSNRSRRDEDDDYDTTDEDDEGSSCDDSSSNASRAQPNNPPLHNQINSFTIALNQQVEDDDYDN